jgi:hypothetical protein
MVARMGAQFQHGEETATMIKPGNAADLSITAHAE